MTANPGSVHCRRVAIDELVVEALVRFREELASLPECMRDVGVDEDIVDFVLPSIDAQRTQLLALR